MAIPIFAIGGFVLDLTSPWGISDWVYYFIPLLLSVYVGGRLLPILLAAVFSLLMLAGFIFSPPGVDPHFAMFSRLMGVSVLWVMAFVIWQRKQADEEVRKLSLAIEHSPVSIIITDKAGNIEYVNPKFMEVTGYSAREVIGKNPRILKSGEMPPGNYKRLWETIVAGGEWRGEFHNRKKNGELYWEWASISPIYDAAGHIAHFLAVKEDITERKRTEKEFKESKIQFESLFEDAPVGYHELDEAGRITRVNRTELVMLGYTTEEMVGHFMWDFVAEREKAREAVMARLAGKTPATELVERNYRRKDGAFLPVLIENRILYDDDGRVIGIRSTLQDITERKRMEHSLAETLDFNRKIISDAPVGILVYKASGQCVLANEAAARTVNATVSQLLNQDFRQLESWRNSGLLKLAEKTLATGSPQQCESHFVSTFGKEIWLVCQFSPFVRGDEPHLLFLFSDITEKKKFETQFLRSQRMESIGTLAGGIAHDLNNVLTPLLVAVQMLKEKITDDDGQQLLRVLETNVRRGASLVKQVLAFGRGVTGERTMVYPAHVAREIKQIVHETFPKSVKFEFHSPDDLWTIIGDPTQIHQVLLNLCVNARDAMPKGGTLVIHMENVMFDEVYAGMNLEARPGPYVRIKVEDTGTGIPKAIQDKIFDPFFTTKALGKGTGLGLSTTLAIVKGHGGFINYHSTTGKGTVFEVYFPANTTLDELKDEEIEQSKLPHGHNELVLVVDDEEPIRNLAQKVLTRFGYRVLLAADGAEAVSVYAPRQKEIDVVITDMAMPIMDGPATVVALKAINAGVRIVSSTGLASDGGLAMVKNTGIQHFIPKPYTAETILNTLHEVLHGNSENNHS
ncbi:MAG: PAS domain S-box protein [Verrucomicrobiota bacterium]